jgi:hypothetical protein
MFGTTLQYEYKGYQYRTYLDVEDDNQKLFHYCFKDGKEIKMPYDFQNSSPYRRVSPEAFINFVQDLEVFIQG